MKYLIGIKPAYLALVSGVVTGVSYHSSFHVGFLAWIGLIPLIHIVTTHSPRQSAWFTYLASVAANFIAFHWIGFNSGTTFLPVLLSLTGAVLYLGIFWAILAYIVSFIKNDFSPWITLPFAWVTMEWIRSLGPLGFPWANLALSQSQYLPLIQLADVMGTYGIAFWIVMINVGLYLAITGGRPVRYITFTVILFVLIGTYGFIQIEKIGSLPVSKRVHIAVTQPNVDPNEKWDRENRKAVFALMDSLHVEANKLNPDLVLWPETALPTYLKLSRTNRKKVLRRVIEGNTPLLTGTVDKKWDENKEASFYNGAIFLKPDGSYDMYSKVFLVPFAEYIPLSGRFPILKKLNFGQGNFVQGDDYTVFRYDSTSFSNVICYESSVPDVVRRFIQKGSEFITIEANDGYLGNSTGPYQHFECAVLRAVENRISIVRSANTGISGLIDPVGRIIHKVPIGKQEIFLANVDIIPYRSWYSIHGDKFAMITAMIMIIFIGGSVWKRFREQ